MSSTSVTSVVIIYGVGISSLVFGHGLLKFGIPFRIFERDSTLNVRLQGYRRINSIGIKVLSDLLPPQLFERLNVCCSYSHSSGASTLSSKAQLIVMQSELQLRWTHGTYRVSDQPNCFIIRLPKRERALEAQSRCERSDVFSSSWSLKRGQIDGEANLLLASLSRVLLLLN